MTARRARGRDPRAGGRAWAAGLLLAGGVALAPALPCGLGGVAAAQAPAGEAPAARSAAAVVVTGPAGEDPFVAAYVAAVAGELLAARALDLRPIQASNARLRALGEGFGCAASDDCTRALAREVDTPILLFVEAERLPPRRRGRRGELSLTVVGVVVTELGVTRAAPAAIVGREQDLARLLAARLGDFPPAPLPCTVAIETTAGPGTTLAVGAGPPAPARARVFLPAGDHALTLEAPGREPATTRLACAPGARYALRVE